MKKVLIIVLSSEFEPYINLRNVSKRTWDSIEVDGVVGTIYACGIPRHHQKENEGNVMYFNTGDTLYDMGYRNLAVFDWALKNVEFDYIFRCNASCYCNKKELIKYIQTLPDENVFTGLKVNDEVNGDWAWGGGSFILSKDVVEKIVGAKKLWDHSIMEDMAISRLVFELGVPLIDGVACSIDRKGDGWLCMLYGGGKSFEFSDFSEIKKAEGQFSFRVKQDGKRWVDEFIMEELFKHLK